MRSMEILDSADLRVHNDEFLTILQKKGAKVDFIDSLVRHPRELVEVLMTSSR